MIRGSVGRTVGASSSAQLARAQDFVVVEDPERCGWDGYDRQSLSSSAEHFDRVPLGAIAPHVVLHWAHDISSPQVVSRKIVEQSDIRVEFELHCRRISIGINVMNLVTPDKCSVIQIVRTRNGRPPAPGRSPTHS